MCALVYECVCVCFSECMDAFMCVPCCSGCMCVFVCVYGCISVEEDLWVCLCVRISGCICVLVCVL